MNAEVKLLAVKSAIYQMGLRFNQEPSKEKIEAYAKDLVSYTPEQITYAFRQVINSGSAFFPSLAEILKHLRPSAVTSKDMGNDVANEIIQKCIDKGRYRTDEIIFELSDLAKEVLTKNRYLIMEILNSEESQVPTIRAQIRDLVHARNEIKKTEAKNVQLERLGIATTLLPKNEMKILSFNDFNPEGA